MVEGGSSTRSLEFTPTWAVATVCTVFVVISLIIVAGIEKLEAFLRHERRKALYRALDKMKEELMLLGFISLLLTVFQNYVASICIKSEMLERLTPCPLSARKSGYAKGDAGKAPAPAPDGGTGSSAEPHRRLLMQYVIPAMLDDVEPMFRRSLIVENPATCREGYESFVSTTGLHQLHTFIFVLACVHVVYSVIAMGLAILKIRGWKSWETESHSNTHDSLAELSRTLTMHRQSTFVAYHTSKPWSRHRFTVWIVCFFRQFGQSVTRADYLSLRLGFITNHNTGLKFDFHGYMIRSMEDEFREIVGISAWLWAFVVLFLLFNLDGSNLYFWLSFLPVVLILVIGAKLQHIIATLALENARVKGQQIKPRDDLFWFNRPKLLLRLIHFILFQNAFELATFLWFLWQFGFSSCLLKNKSFVYVRIGLGVLTQILCSYSTLPLYALVTQMGSHYKESIFQNDVKEKLHKWRKGAKRRARLGGINNDESSHAETSVDGSEYTTKRGSITDLEESSERSERIDERSAVVDVAPGSRDSEGKPIPQHLRGFSEPAIITQEEQEEMPLEPKEKKFFRAFSVSHKTADDSKVPYFKAFTVREPDSSGAPAGSSYTPRPETKDSFKFQPYL